jgi:hypothetical protein
MKTAERKLGSPEWSAILTTRDAQGLYSRVGFTPVTFPERFI